MYFSTLYKMQLNDEHLFSRFFKTIEEQFAYYANREECQNCINYKVFNILQVQFLVQCKSNRVI